MSADDFPRYFKQAEPMLPTMNERSREGYHYGLAFVLAGSWWDWRDDVPYGTGKPKRDAWLSGFDHGRQRAEREAAK